MVWIAGRYDRRRKKGRIRWSKRCQKDICLLYKYYKNARNKKSYSSRRQEALVVPIREIRLCAYVVVVRVNNETKRRQRKPAKKKDTRGIYRLSASSSIIVRSTRRTAAGIPENHAPGSAHFAHLAKGLLFLLALLTLLCAGLLHHLDHALDPARLLVRQLRDFLAIASRTSHAHLGPAVLAAGTA